MKHKLLPRSLRKHIAQEKGRIRREVGDKAEQVRLVSELLGRYRKEEKQ
ncbi:MAG: hypothetical protein Q8Q38_03225 [bacterium]|nr:hypothetical protein [bacterium]